MSRRGWSQKQDEAVKQLVSRIGIKNWSAVASQLSQKYKFKERTGKQCRQRYHNHLDPKISKRNWTSQEQQILFKQHKVYGNKWTCIAEHLSGRTDNTIKNHFYSTIRRSLRRMSKLIGSKNSTKQMKYIKPSTLSKIFAINTNPISIQQIQEQKKKCQENVSYRQLVDYINTECQDLTDVILEFSNYKPKGKNMSVEGSEKVRYEKVLEKMERLNIIYQKMRKEQKRINATLHMRIDEESSSQESNSQDNQNRMDEQKSHKSQSSVQHIILSTNVTRSKRQIKPPKKFIQQLGSSKSLGKNQKKPIVIKKSSLLIKQLEQEKGFQNLPSEKIQFLKRQSDRVASNLQMFDKQPEFQLNFKESQIQFPFTQQFQIGQTPLAYTSNYFFNTPALQFQSPAGGMSATSVTAPNIFSHISSLWTVKNGQLEDIRNTLTSQIANNTAVSLSVAQNQSNREDLKTNSSSNINCSPNSAFKSCH